MNVTGALHKTPKNKANKHVIHPSRQAAKMMYLIDWQNNSVRQMQSCTDTAHWHERIEHVLDLHPFETDFFTIALFSSCHMNGLNPDCPLGSFDWAV